MKLTGFFILAIGACYCLANEGVPRYKRADFQPQCMAGGPLTDLNFHAGAFLNIFDGLTIGCDGLLDMWAYYATQPGAFYASIWRPSSGDTFELVGKTKIMANKIGAAKYRVPMGEQFRVRSNDIIGIAYEYYVDDVNGGVVPYEDSRRSPNPALTLYPIHNSNTRNEQLYVGGTVSGVVAGVRRTIALKAIVTGGEDGEGGGDGGEESGTVMELGYDISNAPSADAVSRLVLVTDASQSANADGTLISWTVYTFDRGSFYLQVWRPAGSNRYSLVGSTYVEVEGQGSWNVDLSGSQRIQVQPGDTLGITYTADTPNVPLMGYEPCQQENRLRFHQLAAADDYPTMGTSFTFNVAECRRYSFRARILLSSVAPTPPPDTGGGGGDGGGGGGGGSCGMPAITPNTRNNRIVGGSPAIAHSWPWQVSLQTGNRFPFCGGTLVDPEWVVTAAHCVTSWGAGYVVVIGRHDTNQAAAVEEAVNVASVHKHEYRPGDNDIAMLRLARRVSYKPEISPACLPSQGEEFPDGTPCYTTGWGTLSSGGSTPQVLMQVRVPLISNDRCNAPGWYGGSINIQNMICAGYEEGGRDSCQGDSGGPLVCQKGGRWLLVGVVSWGYGCADARKPGVYAKTSYFVDWIDSYLAL